MDVNDLSRRSGNFSNSDSLVQFLYELMRDHVPPGVVEKLVMESVRPGQVTQYSNGWLAQYALDVARRICPHGDADAKAKA